MVAEPIKAAGRKKNPIQSPVWSNGGVSGNIGFSHGQKNER